MSVSDFRGPDEDGSSSPAISETAHQTSLMFELIDIIIVHMLTSPRNVRRWIPRFGSTVPVIDAIGCLMCCQVSSQGRLLTRWMDHLSDHSTTHLKTKAYDHSQSVSLTARLHATRPVILTRPSLSHRLSLVLSRRCLPSPSRPARQCRRDR